MKSENEAATTKRIEPETGKQRPKLASRLRGWWNGLQGSYDTSKYALLTYCFLGDEGDPETWAPIVVTDPVCSEMFVEARPGGDGAPAPTQAAELEAVR